MLMKIEPNISFESTKGRLQRYAKPPPHYQHKFQESVISPNPPLSNLAIFNYSKQGFQSIVMNNKSKRKVFVNSSVEPGLPSSGPPFNSLTWIFAIAIAVVVPFVNYKWGPLLRNKIETTLKIADEVVEAVEKVAEEVEKVAEDVAKNLPEGGKLREAVDFVENLAEKAAKDAGAIDDFIDKIQEEEEQAESFIESLRNEPKISRKESGVDDESTTISSPVDEPINTRKDSNDQEDESKTASSPVDEPINPPKDSNDQESGDDESITVSSAVDESINPQKDSNDQESTEK